VYYQTNLVAILTIKARNSQSVANAFDFWRQKKSNISANYLTTTEDLMSAAAAAR
jgi:hypothetical protein